MAEVARLTVRLAALGQHLQSALEGERGRLARELHDELGALLMVARLDTARLHTRLADQAADTLEPLLHLEQTLDEVGAVKRRMTERLNPASLAQLGLPATLQALAQEVGNRAGLTVHLALEPVVLSPSVELVAYRLVQEALTNIGKHAHARQIWVTLAQRGSCVGLTVRDDGIGFDIRAPQGLQQGLVGLRWRVETAGGALDVQSAPGRGSTLHASLPAVAA